MKPRSGPLLGPQPRHGYSRAATRTTLLQGTDRELLVPEPDRCAALWTSRVWPGAVIVGGEIVGSWRRANADVSIQPWRRLSAGERDVVVAEAESLPLPGLEGQIRVRWGD